MSNTSSRHPVRVKSHVLRLLGDELIGDDGLAVFELVKNSYDADATSVSIVMDIENTGYPTITISDDGTGMSLIDIQDKWLVLATDSKRGNKNRLRSTKHHRLPLGEKGIGRMAAFKLGNELTLTTRASDQRECVVTVNLEELLEQGPFLENLNVHIEERLKPSVFRNECTGTRIEIGGLHRKAWERADLRKLFRLITSLSSPFDTPEGFNVEFSVPGREKDLKGMLGPADFLDQSIWKFSFDIDQKGFRWKYEFNPPLWKSVKSNKRESKKGEVLLLERYSQDSEAKRPTKDDPSLVFDESMLKGIGPISGNIYGFYLRSEVLKASGNQSQLKKWLEDQTGIRVYRDGVRVFNYGEVGDDWLGLNVRRINRPSERFGANSVVAAINLNLEDSSALKEKTNREGFDSGGAYLRFHQLVLSAFAKFEREAKEDREKLDNIIRGNEDTAPPHKFVDAIQNLKDGIRAKKIDPSFKPDLDAIEAEYAQLRDVMVSAGTAGLNLAVIFHEIEREVDALAAAAERGLNAEDLRKQIEQIYYMLHGFSPLLQKNPVKLVFCSEVIEQATRIRRSRFQFHKVTFSAPILVKEEEDFRIRAASNLLVGAIGNIIDNAMYWCRVRKESEKRPVPIAIRVMTSYREEDGSSLIAIVDNGTGFSENSISKGSTAFYTERPGGMGLGLYFANLVVEQMGGTLTLSSADELRDELDVPAAFDGAAVVLRFKGNR